jgi:ATP-dependent helicase/nuclease subunit A
MEAAARQPAVLAHLRTVRNLPPAHLDTDERAALASLARVLLHAASQLKLVFRDAGCVDHSEIAAVARQALNAATGLGEDTLRHTARVTHLLIDEFQDISPEQLELVQAITSGWAEGDGHSLFCVGDPMQSIYLFRDAEVGLFLQVRANGVGDIRLEPLQLTRNFRSQQALVEWSNQAFRQIFPPVENLRSSAVTFLAAQVARATDVRLSAEVRILAQADDDAVAEARHIARELMELREKSPELRVAVLVQSRALAGPILRALRDRGMPVLGVDLASLAERPVVRDLAALGQALLDSGDRTAWLAVLRAPTCGLLLADLLVLAEAEGPGPLVERLDRPDVLVGLSADALARLRRAGPVLQAAWRARGSRGIAENIEQCWLQLGGSAACSDAAELDVARQFLLALRNLEEREGPLAPRRLAALADRLLDRGHAVGANPVEVLTIHAAKGLEWDVVFVPGLGRGTRRDDAPLLYSLELPGSRGSDLLLAVRSLGRPNTSDPLARYIRFLQSERQDNERLRLLYVAATRARLRLYLSGHAPQDRNGQARPRSGSLLQRLWPAVAHEFAGLAPGRAQPAADGAALPMLWKRLPADFQPPQAPCLPDFESLTRAQADDDESWIEFAWVGPLARAAGTVMHAELERLARMGEAAVSELASRTHACATGLRELGIPADLAASTASQIIARLAQLVREDTARWLLFAAHRTDASELRLSGMVDGELRNVVIDRSFVAADGTRWIVDYKTGVHHGSGLEEFVARELTRYAPQLRLYAALASRLGPEPVRAALYFPWLGEFRELQSATST